MDLVSLFVHKREASTSMRVVSSARQMVAKSFTNRCDYRIAKAAAQPLLRGSHSSRWVCAPNLVEGQIWPAASKGRPNLFTCRGKF